MTTEPFNSVGSIEANANIISYRLMAELIMHWHIIGIIKAVERKIALSTTPGH